MSDEPNPDVQLRPFNEEAGEEGHGLRVHDVAMTDWLRTIKIKGRNAKVVRAWNSRMFSQQTDLHEEAKPKEPLALPTLSLTALGMSPEPDRWTRSPVRMTGPGPTSPSNTMYTSPAKDGVYHFPFPTPWAFDYQVDIESKTMQDMRILRSRVMERFSNHPHETYLVVKFPIYGEKMIYLEWVNGQDTSELETGENERTLRYTFTFRLHGWMFRQPDVVKTIKNVHHAIIDGDRDPWYCSYEHMHFAETPDGRTKLVSIDENPETTPPDRVLLLLSWDEQGLIP